MQCVPQLRAPWASIVVTSIAIVVAVLTVLVSAPAVRAGDERALPQTATHEIQGMASRARRSGRRLASHRYKKQKVQAHRLWHLSKPSRIHPYGSGQRKIKGLQTGYCAEFGTKRSQVQILSPRQKTPGQTHIQIL